MKSATLLLWSLGLFAQRDAGTRELFFFKKPHPSAVSSQAIRVPVGLRYSILRRNEAGRMAEVDAAGTFITGTASGCSSQPIRTATSTLFTKAPPASGHYSFLPARRMTTGSRKCAR